MSEYVHEMLVVISMLMNALRCAHEIKMSLSSSCYGIIYFVMFIILCWMHVCRQMMLRHIAAVGCSREAHRHGRPPALRTDIHLLEPWIALRKNNHGHPRVCTYLRSRETWFVHYPVSYTMQLALARTWRESSNSCLLWPADCSRICSGWGFYFGGNSAEWRTASGLPCL